MAAHDTTPDPNARLAALTQISETALADIRRIVDLEGQAADWRRALETAAADLARAHGGTLAVIRARTLAEAHQAADADVVELAVAHRAALRALETIGRSAPARGANIVPFRGRRA